MLTIIGCVSLDLALAYLDHIHDGRPPVLTDPSIAAIGTSGSPGRSLVSVGEGVGRHDPLEGVVMSHVKPGGQLVFVGLLVGQNSSGTAMTSLVVMIVNKCKSMEAVSQSIGVTTGFTNKYYRNASSFLWSKR